MLTRRGKAVWAGWCYLPDPATTNNVAEYSALLFGCDALEKYGVATCGLVGDSKLVARGVAGALPRRRASRGASGGGAAARRPSRNL